MNRNQKNRKFIATVKTLSGESLLHVRGQVKPCWNTMRSLFIIKMKLQHAEDLKVQCVEFSDI